MLHETSQLILHPSSGATLTFHGNGQNGRMITNFLKLVVPEVRPAPQSVNGQFKPPPAAQGHGPR